MSGIQLTINTFGGAIFVDCQSQLNTSNVVVVQSNLVGSFLASWFFSCWDVDAVVQESCRYKSLEGSVSQGLSITATMQAVKQLLAVNISAADCRLEIFRTTANSFLLQGQLPSATPAIKFWR